MTVTRRSLLESLTLIAAGLALPFGKVEKAEAAVEAVIPRKEVASVGLVPYSTNASDQQGFAYNTSIGFRRWRAALAKLKSGAAVTINVSLMGDSITEGALSGSGAAEWITKGWVGRVRARLAALFGDVGSGYIPSYYPYGSPRWTFTGTWTPTSFGTTGLCKYTTENGASATLNFNGTGIGVVTVKLVSAGTFTVSVDGGAPTSFNCGNATTINAFAFEVTGLTDGDHTLTVTATVTGGKAFYLLGAYPIKGSAGVRLNMVGRYGTKIADSITERGLSAEIDLWNPVLTVIALGANDYSAQTAVATYKAGVQTAITRAKQHGDVLLLSLGLRNDTGALAIPQAEYFTALRQLATENSVAFIDIADRWGGSAAYANATLGFLADGVHPNDYGHQDIATAVLNHLLEER